MHLKLTEIFFVIKEGIVMDTETKVRSSGTRKRSSKHIYQTECIRKAPFPPFHMLVDIYTTQVKILD